VVGLADQEESLVISLSVSIQYRRVTDRQTHTLLRHSAVKLNALYSKINGYFSAVYSFAVLAQK